MQEAILKQVCHSYIHGAYQQTAGDNGVPNYHPASNEIINVIDYAALADIHRAVESSQAAFTIWSRFSVNQRSVVLLRAAELLRERVNELAHLEVWDTGKPVSEALSVDVISAADALEYFAKIALAETGTVVPNTTALIYTRQEPLGVCVGIGAWNYPLQIACWKAAPALVMGNTMIFKPSELTPMSALVLAEVFIQAGMPAGVFNVVLGDGVVAEKLLAHPGIAKISFTGSVATGRKILSQAAQQLLPVTLELGGKSPLIIFADADIDQAVTGAMLANFYTQGEICSNGTRVFIHKKMHDRFLEKLITRVSQLKIGNPFNHETQVGALISRAHLQKVMDFIDGAKHDGAVLCHGGRVCEQASLRSGNFIEPTIFTDCRDEMTLVCEEIFGPVLSLLTFEEEDEVIHRANQSPFGLAAGVFTNDIKRGHRVAHHLQAGVCWVNNYNATPVGFSFGGRKQSGFGRENGLSTLRNYSQEKSIYVELNAVESTYE